MMQLQPAMN